MAAKREEEIRQLNEWLGYINWRENPRWFMTMVNKKDVWHVEEKEAMAWYSQNLYRENVQKYLGNLPASVLHYCAEIKPFMDIIPVGLYSDRQKEQVQQNFINQLIQLISQK